MKTILLSTLMCALLLAAYAGLYPVMPDRWKFGGRAGSGPQLNIMRCENYAFGSENPQIVIVGSSLAARLSNFPGGWFNLSIVAGSSFTGLQIIAESDKSPKYILIEVNELTRPYSDELVERVKPNFAHSIVKAMPILQESAKPTNVLFRMFDPQTTREDGIPLGRHTDAMFHRDLPAGPEPGYAEYAASEGFAFYVSVAVRIANMRLSAEEEVAMVALLKRQIAAVEAKGAHVIFFIAPEHPKVMTEYRVKELSERIHKEFPNYDWVPSVDASAYNTGDATHLTNPSADRYCLVLVDYMNRKMAETHAATRP